MTRFASLLALAATLTALGCSKKERPAGIEPQPGAADPVRAPAGAAPRVVPTVTLAPEAAEPPPDPKTAITGRLTLPEARRGDVGRGDTIFLVAKRPDASGQPVGPPVAVKRLEAATFPLPFVLSQADAMMPGMPWDGAFTITARIDKDGNASTKLRGDVTGIAKKVKVGTKDVAIALDTLQTTDLPPVGGPPAVGAGAGAGAPMANPHTGLGMPGMPPGHP